MATGFISTDARMWSDQVDTGGQRKCERVTVCAHKFSKLETELIIMLIHKDREGRGQVCARLCP